MISGLSRISVIQCCTTKEVRYYETDKKEYALSITEYETGKYKTKQVDVQESSTKYDDGSSYYELETTDGEIIWTIVGDDTNGYTFQNKSNNKYLVT